MLDFKNEMQDNIIRAPIPTKKIQRLYDFLSLFYDYVTRYENAVKGIGLNIAEIKPGYAVLDVAVGTGQTLQALSRRVGQEGIVCGIDFSSKMLEITRKRVLQTNFIPQVHLTLGDARQLPYHDGMFDVVFNSYMIDLIDTPDISYLLTEFKRVLKPSGRLVVISLSKGNTWNSNMKLYEWIYSLCPTLLGGCRPVFCRPFFESLGFQNVNREFVLVGRVIPSEIVWGDKPQVS